MSTEMRLARLGLLHLVDDHKALKAALEDMVCESRKKRNAKKVLHQKSKIVLPVHKLGIVKQEA